MPVMGPSQERAYEEGEKLFTEVIELLKSKHMPEVETFGIVKEEYNSKIEELRALLKELVWLDYCNCF